MFDQMLIRVCLIVGSLITAAYVLRRVRHAKVQIEDTIFWLLFSAALLVLAFLSSSSFCCWPSCSCCPSGSASWIPACAS